MKHAKLCLTSFAILALTASSAAGQPDRAYEEHLENGNRLLEQRAYEDAIAELKKAEALAPGESIAVLYGLSTSYRQTDRPGEAIAACRSFIEATQDAELKAMAYNLLGIWLLGEDEQEDNLRKSRQASREALKLSAGKADRARLNLAEALHREGHDGKVARVLEQYPSYERPDSWRNLPIGPVSDHVFDELSALLLARDPKTPLYFQGSVEAPVKVEATLPQYTYVARDHRIQGLVIVRTVIDDSGEVIKVEVLKGLPYGLSEQAVEAIRGWKFQPATFRGRAVALYYNLTVNFRLP